ncbi:hypothetical protein RM543_03385 [Roseicyclus sp. F158]|uniref:Argininosuccinate lyase n=1 Tax=Tropicimonas omnivorans TaxID=3075590 RepID=A0ABU3DDC4_9RHOB|nr:hypothetical protein [Roseicyclus sp. F158]MDT0681716.1 hypothetical protein [Roseicyclus sp. F158]
MSRFVCIALILALAGCGGAGAPRNDPFGAKRDPVSVSGTVKAGYASERPGFGGGLVTGGDVIVSMTP